MAMVINTNMGAINATRILDVTKTQQTTSMERLTSGLRINKSADDAAGLAVATGMTTQIRGTEQAIRNANDGIGLVQTADGAAEEVINMMQRMRELGIQSMNGTYSYENRKQMNAEVEQLKQEIERIAVTTKFNGMSIMDDSSFSVLTAGSVSKVAATGFKVDLSGLKLHVGWETGSANQIKVILMDFTTLSVLNESIALAHPTSSTYTDNLANARAAVSAIDRDLAAVVSMRSLWGAVQNRLEYTVANLANVNENIQESRSRIQDADYAKESANLARTQVLQQAGMSMLSQANQQSMNVLSLLQ